MELNINKISRQKFRFVWDDPMHSTEVEIFVPDLTKLRYSVSGDWGPHYTFKLNEFESIAIKYNGNSFDSTQKWLYINSPMMADEREAYPFLLKIEDSAKHLVFHLYINSDHEFGKVDVIRSQDGTKLYEFDNQNYLQSRM